MKRSFGRIRLRINLKRVLRPMLVVFIVDRVFLLLNSKLKRKTNQLYKTLRNINLYNNNYQINNVKSYVKDLGNRLWHATHLVLHSFSAVAVFLFFAELVFVENIQNMRSVLFV